MNDNVEKTQNIKYPCLGMYVHTGLIMLFTNQYTGTVVSDPTGRINVGYHSKNWTEGWVQITPNDITVVSKDIPTFEEGGLKFFKPASYVLVKTNESIYNRLTKKYDLPTLTHRIASSIDEVAEQGMRKLDVVFEQAKVHHYSYDTAYFPNIATHDHESIYRVIAAELKAVGGYNIHEIRIDTHAGVSQFRIEW